MELRTKTDLDSATRLEFTVTGHDLRVSPWSGIYKEQLKCYFVFD